MAMGDPYPIVTDAFLLQENARLRAELAAERKRADDMVEDLQWSAAEISVLEVNVTKLREALVKARPYVERDCVNAGTLDAIDAVLAETGSK